MFLSLAKKIKQQQELAREKNRPQASWTQYSWEVGLFLSPTRPSNETPSSPLTSVAGRRSPQGFRVVYSEVAEQPFYYRLSDGTGSWEVPEELSRLPPVQSPEVVFVVDIDEGTSSSSCTRIEDEEEKEAEEQKGEVEDNMDPEDEDEEAKEQKGAGSKRRNQAFAGSSGSSLWKARRSEGQGSHGSRSLGNLLDGENMVISF